MHGMLHLLHPQMFLDINNHHATLHSWVTCAISLARMAGSAKHGWFAKS